MGILALIVGIIAALCAVMGILSTVPIDPLPLAGYDVTFWFSLAVILFLATITCLLARGPAEYSD